jgi:hypothetical protein
MDIVEKIIKILETNTPTKALRICRRWKGAFGDEYVKIAIAASNAQIHDVDGQYPQMVSLKLNLQDLELSVQVYGGMGGQRIYRKPDADHQFYAMQGIKIPFRMPKKEEGAVLRAIEKFAQNWTSAMKENREVLMHQNLVNYDELLAS